MLYEGFNFEVHLITEGDKFLFSWFESPGAGGVLAGVFGNVEVGDGMCLGDLGRIIL